MQQAVDVPGTRANGYASAGCRRGNRRSRNGQPHTMREAARRKQSCVAQTVKLARRAIASKWHRTTVLGPRRSDGQLNVRTCAREAEARRVLKVCAEWRGLGSMPAGPPRDGMRARGDRRGAGGRAQGRSNNATLVRGSDIACTENPAHQCVSESETSERRGIGHWACTVRGRATEVAYAMRDMSKACGMSWHVGQSSSYAAVSGPNRRSARGASAGRHARQGARRSGRSDGVGKCRKMEIADRGWRNASRSTKIGRDVKRESQGVKRGVACEPEARSTNEAMEPARTCREEWARSTSSRWISRRWQ
ncbi:hypothetical protein L1887_59449 [Cichorium endivia]|nr:hypothetical protein L1887_59449 [Cichorium endivia]